MPVCPRCRDEYREGVEQCAECGVALLPDGAAIPPRVDAVLGRFHPVAAAPVVEVLERRGIAYERRELDGNDVELAVDRAFRDDLRAELVLNWSGLVASLEPEERAELPDGDGHPGWIDAPRGAWMDAQGRLQVERSAEEELEADARRTVGPSLAALGGVLVIFGWWGGSELAVVLGVVLLVVGLLLPT